MDLHSGQGGPLVDSLLCSCTVECGSDSFFPSACKKVVVGGISLEFNVSAMHPCSYERF